MKKIEKYTKALSILIASLTLVACASKPASAPAKPVASVATPSYQNVSLVNIPVGATPKKLQNKDDLREVIELAFAFSDAGDNKRAAEVFIQANSDFSSPTKTLSQSLVSAAICEYFKAGMINEVRENLKLLDSYRTDVYDNFDDNESIANIRKLVSK